MLPGKLNFFKKRKKLSIFLALLIFFIFYEVIPEIRGDKVFLLTRLFYSHPELADKIEVKAYILTDEQVGELFLHPEREPVLLKNNEFDVWKKGLNGPPPPHANLVFRIKNRSAWTSGRIQYRINDAVSGKFKVLDLTVEGNEDNSYQNFVIPLGGVCIGGGDSPNASPKITYKWRELYSCW